MALTTIGHYRLESQIGHGGSGEVYRAFDTRLNRFVAIKVMRNTPGRDSPAMRRFLREARAASALNHPNIITIHEVGETDAGDQFIIQEFVEGRTLRALVKESLPIETIADIGRQIARALAAAHAAGIVHRDIKPENIMVRGDGYVKMLDFGLAGMTAPPAWTDQTTANMDTAPGVLLGTVSYMAPERARGGAIGPPGDIFGLGVVLYELAAGRRPFAAPTGIGIVAAIVFDQPAPLTDLNTAIPRSFDALVRRMLEKDPAARPVAGTIEEELTTLLEGAGVVRTPAGTAAGRSTVGRDDQQKRLRRAYARVQEGKSVMLTVTGEPGIGKTTLVEDFLRELVTDGPQPIVARGRCSERLAGAEAYLPVLEALDSLLHGAGAPSMEAVMQTVAPTWYVQVATRAAEASIVSKSDGMHAPSQERMKRELGAFFRDVSRAQPVIVFLDDLHWADVSTVDMLNYLAGRFDGMRVLLLATYRPSEMALAQHPFLGIRSDLQARGVCEEVRLGFLELKDVERYLALEFPGHAFPADLAPVIHAKTEGSPLFMADLVRYLRDTGGIIEEQGRWMLARSLPDVPRDLPESVRGMIARKIAQVDERDRRLLLAASVEGHAFDSVTVGEAAEMDAAEVEDRLERLEHVHVFVTRGDEHEFPDRTLTLKYAFVHVLYQNLLYASLQPTSRALLSGRVARSLVAHHGEEVASLAGRLSVLFETAREFAASARYFLIAAQNAVALFGFREALALAERGVDVLRRLPDGPERNKLEIGLQMVRTLALRSIKGWASPDLEPVLARARRVCQQLEDPPELFPVLWSLGLFHMIRGHLQVCRAQADDLMVLARRSGKPAFLMAAHHLGGVVREFLGEMVEASRLLERARELHDPSEHATYTSIYGLDPGMIARAMSSRPLWALGHPDRAADRSRETLALARSQRQPVTLVFALVVEQGIRLYRGEADEAIALGDEIVPLCQEYELAQEIEWARSFQGAALAALGRTGEGIEVLQHSLAAQQALGSGLVRTAFLALLGEALGRAGRADEGLAAVAEGFTHATRTLEGGYLAELHRVRGELLRVAGDEVAAEDSLRAALAHAREQQAKAFELRAATGLARCLASAGRSAEARAVLAPVYEWFTEGHATADLQAARTVLAQMESGS